MQMSAPTQVDEEPFDPAVHPARHPNDVLTIKSDSTRVERLASNSANGIFMETTQRRYSERYE